MIWTQEENTTLSTLAAAGKHRISEMAAMLNKTKNQTTRQLRKLGIKSTYRNPPKYTFNHSYFSEPTLESCYWAGILQTDGCLSKRKGSVTVIWGCSQRDLPHMELFRATIQSTHPIHLIKKKCQLSTSDPEKEHVYRKIVFEGAHRWAEDLKRHFGFDHNKTLRTAPPNLPSLLHVLAYIKGLIDGDGTITHNNQMGGISLSLCGCNRELLMWVQQVIESLGLPKPYRRASHVYQVKGESCYYLHYSGLRAAVLHEILNRVPTPHLSRKWNAPKAMENKSYWKNRPDIWPPETFFTHLLKTAQNPCIIVY